MRILFIIQGWQPESVLKGLPFAKELQKLGHEVEALTGFPHYPQGKIYPGYRVCLLQREEMDGVSVVRVPLYPSHDRSSVRRIATYTSYALSAALMGPWVTKRADVAYVYHPPATVGFPACVLRMLRGIPFVYDIQDLWPDTLVATGMFNSRFGLRLVDKYCKLVYRLASRIVVLSPGFKAKICERGVAADKIDVIYNWSDDTVVYPVKRNAKLAKQLGLSGRFNIMFAGNMGSAQGLDAVLDAAKIVSGRCPEVHFVFVGSGMEEDTLKRKASEMVLGNVLFLPRRPRSEIAEVLSLADVLLVHLKDDPLFRITIPSKVQAYMAVSRPILIGVEGDASDLVLRAGAGVACKPGDARSIADGVCKLYSMDRSELEAMGRKGLSFYKQELSLQRGARRFAGIFEQVAGQPRQ